MSVSRERIRLNLMNSIINLEAILRMFELFLPILLEKQQGHLVKWLRRLHKKAVNANTYCPLPLMKCPGGPQYDLGQALETPATSHELAKRVERTRHGSNCESLLISAMVLSLIYSYTASVWEVYWNTGRQGILHCNLIQIKWWKMMSRVVHWWRYEEQWTGEP